MAFPFGGHPKLSDYLEWVEAQGCTVNDGHHRRGSKVVPVKLIKNPAAEKHAIVMGLGAGEYLVKSQVAYLDRRLGVESPWATGDPFGW